ncbi:MAG TPA: hypothetical protein DCG49_09600 [Ruminococcus sp.]|nr:hypothetical protein [Ruminococcus sp.]
MDSHFRITSETYAVKTQRLLDRYRYHWRVRKMTAQNGCMYLFTVSEPPESLFSLLDAQGIPYQIN